MRVIRVTGPRRIFVEFTVLIGQPTGFPQTVLIELNVRLEVRLNGSDVSAVKNTRVLVQTESERKLTKIRHRVGRDFWLVQTYLLHEQIFDERVECGRVA